MSASLLSALGHQHPFSGYEAWLKYSHWLHTPWEFCAVFNYCFKNISVSLVHLASVSFTFRSHFIHCCHDDGCAVPRSNNEWGKDFPLLLKLTYHEIHLAGPWVNSAFCLTAALAAAPCRTVGQGMASTARSNCCLLNSGTFNSAVCVNTESTWFPVSGKVGSLLKLCAGNREPSEKQNWCE